MVLKVGALVREFQAVSQKLHVEARFTICAQGSSSRLNAKALNSGKDITPKPWIPREPSGMSVCVKIMVPFGVPIIVRHLLFRVPLSLYESYYFGVIGPGFLNQIPTLP